MFTYEEEKKEITPFQTVLIFLAVLTFLVVTGGFLSPMILVNYWYTASLQDAYFITLNSFTDWCYCIVFWIVVTYSVSRWRDRRYKQSLKRVHPTGRQFICYSCQQLVVEKTYGLLDSTGVCCPFCKSVNVLPDKEQQNVTTISTPRMPPN